MANAAAAGSSSRSNVEATDRTVSRIIEWATRPPRPRSTRRLRWRGVLGRTRGNETAAQHTEHRRLLICPRHRAGRARDSNDRRRRPRRHEPARHRLGRRRYEARPPNAGPESRRSGRQAGRGSAREDHLLGVWMPGARTTSQRNFAFRFLTARRLSRLPRYAAAVTRPMGSGASVGLPSATRPSRPRSTVTGT
jgi:hypothetical protein